MIQQVTISHIYGSCELLVVAPIPLTLRISLRMPNTQTALMRASPQGEFSVETVPIPSPTPGQLLVKVVSVALNPADWKLHILGYYADSYPMTSGFDGAGIVEEVGSGVSGYNKGDRV